MDKFTRYKTLRALWARAKSLLAHLNGPRHLEARARAMRWQQIQVAERQTSDGIVRGTGDPDSASRHQERTRESFEHRGWQAHREMQRQWYEQQRQQRR